MYPEVILSNHNLDKLFKEELVSIPDDNLILNKLDRFYKKYNGGDWSGFLVKEISNNQES